MVWFPPAFLPHLRVPADTTSLHPSSGQTDPPSRHVVLLGLSTTVNHPPHPHKIKIQILFLSDTNTHVEVGTGAEIN